MATDPPAGEPFNASKEDWVFLQLQSWRLAGFTKKCFGKRSEVPFVRFNWKKKRALSCAFRVGEGIFFVEGKNNTNQKNLITNPEASRKT